MNTTQVGNVSESAVMLKFLEKDYQVLIPFGGRERYDLLLDKNNKFTRVQVKTGRLKNGAVTASIASPNKKNDYRGDIDIFAIYCPDNKRVYIVDIDEIKDKKSISLRVAPTKHNRLDTKYAKDYML